MTPHPSRRAVRSAALLAPAVTAALILSPTATATTRAAAPVALAPASVPARDADLRVRDYPTLSDYNRRLLRTTARDSWKLYRIGVGVDRVTALPLDNVTYAGGSTTPTAYGTYTSAANVGVYLWAIVSARDLGLITTAEAETRVRATLATVARIDRHEGFLHQWYDTRTGDFIMSPEDPECTAEDMQGKNNCTFISQVDNGWYVSGLIVVRRGLPGVAAQANQLLSQVDFGIFYDDREQTSCNVNQNLPDRPPTGQMYGGVYIGFDPATTGMYHNGAIYSDPRISAYLGMGLRQMPGDVWWRTWRTMPPPAPGCENSDPVFDWQGQWPPPGRWTPVADPISGKTFNVWEGHYKYPTGDRMRYLPSWNNGMFESLMAGEIVPETSWGMRNFGSANKRMVVVQKRYAVDKLGYPVWGMSPSSTSDDTGGYGIYGVSGWAFPEGQQLANCAEPWCGNSEEVVTPHASFLALDPQPAMAMTNIQRLKRMPGLYGVNGFFDSVNPTTGAVGHRYLVLDQSMIMVSINNALNNRRIQRYFAADPVSWAAKAVLQKEVMSFWD